MAILNFCISDLLYVGIASNNSAAMAGWFSMAIVLVRGGGFRLGMFRMDSTENEVTFDVDDIIMGVVVEFVKAEEQLELGIWKAGKLVKIRPNSLD